MIKLPISERQYKDDLVQLFALYDEDEKGHLTSEEFGDFINNIRAYFYYPKCDPMFLRQMMIILETSPQSKIVTAENLMLYNSQIIPMITQTGKKFDKMLRRLFIDFDIDESGYLESPEIKLLCNLMCDKLQLKRCTQWQINFVISIVDLDGDRQIDLEEFVAHYSKIHMEILRNKSLKKKRTTADAFFGFQINNEFLDIDMPKSEIITEIGEYIIKWMRKNGRPTEPEGGNKGQDRDEADNLMPENYAMKLNKIMGLSKYKCKELVPIADMVAPFV
jgi:Ca2+-binding EF-hand superfamily protein